MINVHTQIPLHLRFSSSVIFVLQHMTQKSWVEKIRKKNIQRILKHLEKSSSPEILSVEKVHDLDEKTFVKNYLNKGIPVIFSEGAKEWPCTMKWSLDFLKTQYPDEEFSLIDSTGLVEQQYDQTKESQDPVFIDKIKAKDFVEKTKAGEKPYLRFCPIMETHPELEQDLDQSWLKKMRRCFLGISYQSFIGPSGRKTPLHSETTAFFYIMADGEKRWTLYSPTAFPLLNPEAQGRGYNFSRFNFQDADETKYPGAKKLHRYECLLKKGDILFVPAWMWHEVENTTAGWGVSYRMTNLRGFLKHPVFVFIRLFLTKPSFFEILYYSFFKSDIAKRKKNLLTPKIFLKK